MEYLSLRYSCIKAYEVETAGMFDLDAEFKIYTNLDFSRTCIKTEIRKDQSDIMEVLWHFNNQLLGTDDMPLEEVYYHLMYRVILNWSNYSSVIIIFCTVCAIGSTKWF